MYRIRIRASSTITIDVRVACIVAIFYIWHTQTHE